MEALKRVLSVPIADPTRKEINEAKLQKKVFEQLDPLCEKVIEDLEDLSDRYRFKGSVIKIIEQKFPNEVYRGEKNGHFGKIKFSNRSGNDSIGADTLELDLNFYWDLEGETLKLRIVAEGRNIDNTEKELKLNLPFSEDSLKQYKAVEDWLSGLFYVKGFTKVSQDRLPMKRLAKEFQELKVTPEEWDQFVLRGYHGDIMDTLENDISEANNSDDKEYGWVTPQLAKKMKVKDTLEAGKKALEYHKKQFEKYRDMLPRFNKGPGNSLMYKLLDEETGGSFSDWVSNHLELAGEPAEKIPMPEILKQAALPEPAAAGVAESAKTDEILVFDKDGQYMVGIRNKGEWDMFQMSPDGKNKYQGTGFQLKPPAGSEKVDWKSLPEQMQKAIKERKSKAVSALEKITVMSMLKKILAADKE